MAATDSTQLPPAAADGDGGGARSPPPADAAQAPALVSGSTAFHNAPQTFCDVIMTKYGRPPRYEPKRRRVLLRTDGLYLVTIPSGPSRSPSSSKAGVSEEADPVAAEAPNGRESVVKRVIPLGRINGIELRNQDKQLLVRVYGEHDALLSTGDGNVKKEILTSLDKAMRSAGLELSARRRAKATFDVSPGDGSRDFNTKKADGYVTIESKISLRFALCQKTASPSPYVLSTWDGTLRQLSNPANPSANEASGILPKLLMLFRGQHISLAGMVALKPQTEADALNAKVPWLMVCTPMHINFVREVSGETAQISKPVSQILRLDQSFSTSDLRIWFYGGTNQTLRPVKDCIGTSFTTRNISVIARCINALSSRIGYSLDTTEAPVVPSEVVAARRQSVMGGGAATPAKSSGNPDSSLTPGNDSQQTPQNRATRVPSQSPARMMPPVDKETVKRLVKDYKSPSDDLGAVFHHKNVLLARRCYRLTSWKKWEPRVLVLTPLSILISLPDGGVKRSIGYEQVTEFTYVDHSEDVAAILSIEGDCDLIIRPHESTVAGLKWADVAAVFAYVAPDIRVIKDDATVTKTAFKDYLAQGRNLKRASGDTPAETPKQRRERAASQMSPQSAASLSASNSNETPRRRAGSRFLSPDQADGVMEGQRKRLQSTVERDLGGLGAHLDVSGAAGADSPPTTGRRSNSPPTDQNGVPPPSSTSDSTPAAGTAADGGNALPPAAAAPVIQVSAHDDAADEGDQKNDAGGGGGAAAAAAGDPTTSGSNDTAGTARSPPTGAAPAEQVEQRKEAQPPAATAAPTETKCSPPTSSRPEQPSPSAPAAAPASPAPADTTAPGDSQARPGTCLWPYNAPIEYCSIAVTKYGQPPQYRPKSRRLSIRSDCVFVLADAPTGVQPTIKRVIPLARIASVELRSADSQVLLRIIAEHDLLVDTGANRKEVLTALDKAMRATGIEITAKRRSKLSFDVSAGDSSRDFSTAKVYDFPTTTQRLQKRVSLFPNVKERPHVATNRPATVVDWDATTKPLSPSPDFAQQHESIGVPASLRQVLLTPNLHVSLVGMCSGAISSAEAMGDTEEDIESPTSGAAVAASSTFSPKVRFARAMCVVTPMQIKLWDEATGTRFSYSVLDVEYVAIPKGQNVALLCFYSGARVALSPLGKLHGSTFTSGNALVLLNLISALSVRCGYEVVSDIDVAPEPHEPLHVLGLAARVHDIRAPRDDACAVLASREPQALLVRRAERLTSRAKWESRLLMVHPQYVAIYTEKGEIRRSIAVKDISYISITRHAKEGETLTLVVPNDFDCALRSFVPEDKKKGRLVVAEAIADVTAVLAHIAPHAQATVVEVDPTQEKSLATYLARMWRLRKPDGFDAAGGLAAASSGTADDAVSSPTLGRTSRSASLSPRRAKSASMIGARTAAAAAAAEGDETKRKDEETSADAPKPGVEEVPTPADDDGPGAATLEKKQSDDAVADVEPVSEPAATPAADPPSKPVAEAPTADPSVATDARVDADETPQHAATDESATKPAEPAAPQPATDAEQSVEEDTAAVAEEKPAETPAADEKKLAGAVAGTGAHAPTLPEEPVTAKTQEPEPETKAAAAEEQPVDRQKQQPADDAAAPAEPAATEASAKPEEDAPAALTEKPVESPAEDPKQPPATEPDASNDAPAQVANAPAAVEPEPATNEAPAVDKPSSTAAEATEEPLAEEKRPPDEAAPEAAKPAATAPEQTPPAAAAVAAVEEPPAAEPAAETPPALEEPPAAAPPVESTGGKKKGKRGRKNKKFGVQQQPAAEEKPSDEPHTEAVESKKVEPVATEDEEEKPTEPPAEAEEKLADTTKTPSTAEADDEPAAPAVDDEKKNDVVPAELDEKPEQRQAVVDDAPREEAKDGTTDEKPAPQQTSDADTTTASKPAVPELKLAAKEDGKPSGASPRSSRGALARASSSLRRDVWLTPRVRNTSTRDEDLASDEDGDNAASSTRGATDASESPSFAPARQNTALFVEDTVKSSRHRPNASDDDVAADSDGGNDDADAVAWLAFRVRMPDGNSVAFYSDRALLNYLKVASLREGAVAKAEDGPRGARRVVCVCADGPAVFRFTLSFLLRILERGESNIRRGAILVREPEELLASGNDATAATASPSTSPGRGASPKSGAGGGPIDLIEWVEAPLEDFTGMVRDGRTMFQIATAILARQVDEDTDDYGSSDEE